MNLYDYAKLILTIQSQGLSKVRFAKTIYFVHKELSRLGYTSVNDLEYIRMPLGPVPDGYMTLEKDHGDILCDENETGLSYNTINYRLKKRKIFLPSKQKNPLHKDVEALLKRLEGVPTSALVELSHKEYSWLNHTNGERYYIHSKDMKNKFPTKVGRIEHELQEQSLQASLVRGMLEDIVSESTALEYPTDANQ